MGTPLTEEARQNQLSGLEKGRAPRPGGGNRHPLPINAISTQLREQLGVEYVFPSGVVWTTAQWIAYQMACVIVRGELPYVTGRVDIVQSRDVLHTVEVLMNRVEGQAPQSIDLVQHEVSGPGDWRDRLKKLSVDDLKKLEEIMARTTGELPGV